MNTSINIGLKIRSRRQDLHLTQEALAERSNSSVNFISQLETGVKSNVTINKLSEIATGLEISLTGLLDYQIDDRVRLQHVASTLPPALPDTTRLLRKLLGMSRPEAERIARAILELLK